MAWASIGVLIGLGLAQIVSLRLGGIWVVALILVMVSMFHQRRWWSILIVASSALLLGLSQGSHVTYRLMAYTPFFNTELELRGVINDDPTRDQSGRVTFVITDVVTNEITLPGNVYVTSLDKRMLKRGDTVIISGTIKDGFGSYQAKVNFAKVISIQKSLDPIREFRDGFADNLREVIDEPAASLGLGFVVGQRSSLPEDLDDDLRAVGLTHIVVASGYNLTILVRFARRILEGHSKYLATTVSAAAMIIFAFISGFSPSMTRAVIVTGLSLLAWYYGRRFHPFQLILLVAAGTALYNPVYVWADVGWYLSFLAFAGVLIVSPMLIKLICRERKPHPLIQVMFETTAAQLMTLPLILTVFGELPVLSLFSNILVAAVIPLAMALTAVAGLAAGISLTLAALPAAIAELVLGYVLAIVAALSAPAWSQVAFQTSSLAMVVAYIAIAISISVIYVRLRFNFRSSSIVE